MKLPLLFLHKNSIANRLTLQVVFFSTMVVVLATAIQLYFDYQQNLSGIQTFFKSIETSTIRPLEESVWIVDELQVDLQLEGLITHQDIVYAEVTMKGEIAWAKGTPMRTNVVSRTFPLVHRNSGNPKQIGRLRVEASLEGIYQRLLRRLAILLASNTVQILLVSGIILVFFQRKIARHLVRIASHAENIDIQKSEPEPLLLNKPPSVHPDELDQVVAVYNTLCRSTYQAVHRMKLNEQRLRLLFDATRDIIFGVDEAGRCTFINRAGLIHFGVQDYKGFLGQDLLAKMAHNCRRLHRECTVRNQVTATLRDKKVILTDETSLCSRDGRLLNVSMRSYPVFDNDRCVGAIVLFTDISKQQVLELEKQLFTRVFRQAPALILITDAQGVVEYVNSSLEEVTGFTSEQLKGKRVEACFHKYSFVESADQLRSAVHSGKAWSGIFTGTHANGERISLDAQIFPIVDSMGELNHIVAMARNITREVELTTQLHRAQKMEAVGKMAASLAHEFGNPLLGIRLALRDVKQRQVLDPQDRDLLQLAEDECDRLRKLIRNLQQFNRPSGNTKIKFDLHRLLEEILFLNHQFFTRKKVRVERHFDRQPIWLVAVEDQIRQVCINLLINAGDAMAGQGGVIALGTILENEWVKLTVSDNGTGIRPEDSERIFEPFYTTKSAVEGTGLGLSISFDIVQDHGGMISVKSDPGMTVFTVKLPLEQPQGIGQAGVAGLASRVEPFVD